LGEATGEPRSPFIVAFIHGPGGVGKSRLLRACLGGMPHEVRTILLDGREIEPTPDGVLQALASAVAIAGSAPGDPVAAIASDP
ncbi:hypothetical protein, partial [Klebsiella pneumoniae]|uniref:hypothetical protein n=1 Tax=Klebsiella pneumoniae TaxID=573 RepID=UPI003F77784F